MADISTELQAIMDAVYGEEVRGSIHDAIEKINEVSETSAEEAFDALETANQANATANDANIYARAANNTANSADTKATNAESTVTTISATKANWPRDDHNFVTYGEDGQVLVTNGDGTTRWGDGVDPEDIDEAVDTYLDEHGVETTFDIEDDNQGNVEFVGSNTEIGQLKDNVQRLVSDVPVAGQEGNVLTWHALGNSFDAQHINAKVSNDGAGNVTIDGELVTQESDIYGSNDTLTFNGYIPFNGLVTSGGTEIKITVPTPKSMQHVSSIAVTSCVGGVRGISGYIGDTKNDDADWNNMTNVTVSATKINDRLIYLLIKSSAAHADATDNTPVAMACKNLVFKFS